MRPFHQIVLGLCLMAASPVLLMLPVFTILFCHYGIHRGWFPPGFDSLFTSGLAIVTMLGLHILAIVLVISGFAFLVIGIARRIHVRKSMRPQTHL